MGEGEGGVVAKAKAEVERLKLELVALKVWQTVLTFDVGMIALFLRLSFTSI